MENAANYIFLAVIIAICILTIRIIRHPREGSLQDPGEAIIEFGNAYPNEAIRAVRIDKEGSTTFMRLADGKTGLAQIVGNAFIVRLIQPGEVDVHPSESGEGLILNFDQDSTIGGLYEFKDVGDAAEVSMWICGSFGLKMAEHNQDSAS